MELCVKGYFHENFFDTKFLKSLLYTNQFCLLWNFHTLKKKDLVFRKKKFTYSYNNKGDEVGNPLFSLCNFSTIIVNVGKMAKKIESNDNYMLFQSNINPKMRTILIDWLMDVHYKFKLIPKTLFLTVNIIDRFLSLKNISKQKLQLVGVAAMLIASKYEEIYAPETRDFVYITDNAYTRDDIFRMETLICDCLNYDFSSSRLLNILSYNMKKTEEAVDVICLSWYSMEMMLLEYFVLSYPIGVVASTIFFTVRQILKRYYNLRKLKKLKRNYEKRCQYLIESNIILNQNKKHKLTALKRKYSNRKYGEISTGKFCVIY
ncbi:cyclin B (nucleomorph) [Cryptomonas paramecium]|uniref:Cyclin B n=1 Tax=Cryptomonas paramaecium TaxID=2898 RepID=F2HH84_9CRYP|nr:cyclin B [Cryptomonas paramecium]AEA38680.1 cyclin B [Cryptomonas paramecium]|mmetsp:Transcript_52166/g.136370  ORF Transcript_52166/g.136370 Transcript_52166/m.136370 type:complete len:319 (-) Transcript_52166:3997-4953(-)